ncbi:hypothetical protein HK101_007500 [Irineochytrium annulatum]|nr:hypothetical protein HK101_007500 [Irineochytrium annulatum]
MNAAADEALRAEKASIQRKLKQLDSPRWSIRNEVDYFTATDDILAAESNEFITGDLAYEDASEGQLSVLEEILDLRTQYLRGGGDNVRILEQITALELEAASQGHRLIASPASTVARPIKTALYREDESIFEAMDKATQPAYRSDRGFAVFWDFLSGIPFFGISNNIELTFDIFDGSRTCNRLKVIRSKFCDERNDARKYVFQESSSESNASDLTQIHASVGVRIVIQVRILDASLNGAQTEVKPFGWTLLDVFSDELKLNHGRWRLDLFALPIDFKTSTYGLHEAGLKIEGVYLYIRVADPKLLAYHARLSSNMFLEPFYCTYNPENSSGLAYVEQETSFVSMLFDGQPKKYGLRKRSRGDDGVIAKVEEPKAVKRFKDVLGIEATEPWIVPTLPVPGADKDTFGWLSGPPEYVLRSAPAELYALLSFEIRFQIASSAKEGECVIETPLYHGADKSTSGLIFLDFKLTDDLDAPLRLQLRIFHPDKRPPEFKFAPKPVTVKIPFKEDDLPPLQPFAGGEFFLCVDGAMNLPSNCTISRATGTLLTSKAELVRGCTSIETAPLLDSHSLAPKYTMISRIRFPLKINPTATALIRLYTIDSLTQEIALIGVALFNIFLDVKTRDQPADGDVVDVALNEGFPFPDGLNIRSLSARVPCVRLLVRLQQGQPEDSETSYGPYQPTEYEAELTAATSASQESPKITVRDALRHLRDHPRGKKDPKLIAWIVKRLSKDKTIIPMLNLSFIGSYRKEFGFSVSIEAASNLRYKAISVPLLTLSPPIHKYIDKKRVDDGHEGEIPMRACRVVDFDSEVFKNISQSSKLLIVIDIRALTTSKDKPKLEHQGWTVFPVFAGPDHVFFGQYQLPLFEGGPSLKLLKFLAKTKKTFEDAMDAAEGSKMMKDCRKNGSVTIRICDTRRTEEIPYAKVWIYGGIPGPSSIYGNLNTQQKQQGQSDISHLPSEDYLNESPSWKLKKLLPANENASSFARKCANAVAGLVSAPPKG